MKTNKQADRHGLSLKAILPGLKTFLSSLRHVMALAMLFCAANAFAQQFSWDVGQGGAAGPITGSGNWDTTNAYWDPTPNGADVVWGQTSTTAGLDGAVFGGPDGTYTITLDNGQLAYTNLTIKNSGYTFTGSALYGNNPTGSDQATVVVAAGKTVTFSNSMTGNNATLYYECGNGAVVNFMGGGGGAQPQFQSTNSSGTFYFNGTFTYSVQFIEAMCIQTNGSFTTAGFNLGRPGSGGEGSSASNGTWIVTGPSTTFTMSGANLLDGRGGGQGTFIVSNGATASTLISGSSGQNDDLVLCNDSSGHESGVFDVYGGTVNVGASTSSTGGMIQMIPSGAASTEYAVFNQTGGTVNAWGGIFFGDSSSATFSAGSYASFTNSGGFLYIGSVGPNGGGINKGVSFPSTNSITLSGGTVGALGNWSSPMPMTLGTLNGNITFQCANASTAPYNIMLSGPLTGTGGLYVTGGGTLTLSGTNNYAGSTTVSNGTLLVVTTPSGATNGGSLTVDGSAGSPTLAVQSNPGQFFSTGALTFQNSPTTWSNAFGTLSPSASVAPIQVTGGVNFAATPTVIVSGSAIAAGTYPLITYTTSVTGAMPTSASLPGEVTGAYITNIAASKTIALVVTSSSYVTADFWRVGSGAWDINTTADWYQFTVGNAIKYTNGAAVILDDTASGPFPITVTLNTAVSPSSVTANNTPGDNYTISGTGGISGPGSVSVLGGGTLTLTEENSYNGGTSLTSGQLNINNGGDNSGSDSAIGTGPLTITAGAAIDNTGAGAVTLMPSIAENWNGNFTYLGSANSFNTGPGSVTMGGNVTLTVNSNDLIVAGSIGDNGNNNILSKAGNGVLTLLNYNSFGGGFHLLAGQLNLGNPNSTGASALTIESGTSLDNVSGGFLTLGAPSYVWGGPFTYVGSTPNTLDLGTATVTAANNAPPIFVNVVSNTFETDGDLVTGNNVVTKTGLGTWILGGISDSANNVILTVNAGEVILDKYIGFAIGNRGGGGLTVQSNALVLDNGLNGQYGQDPEVGNGQGVAVTLQSGGIFDIYGNTETFDSLTISNGGTLQNGNAGTAAILSVTGNNTGIFSLGDTNCVFDVVATASLTIDATISGPGSLVMTNLGELYLANSNTYTGQTLIQSGTLGLTANAIDDSSGINLAGTNSVLDLSQEPGQLLELFSGQTLSGIGTVSGVVQADSGSLVAPGTPSSVGTLTVTGSGGATTLNGAVTMKLNASASTNDQLLVQQGSLVYGTGSLTVVNLSGTIATGSSFQLFNAPPSAINGAFGGGITLPALAAGLSWNTSNLSVNGTISVVGTAAPMPPHITSVSQVGNNLVFSGTNGPDGGTYYVLTSTNVASALTNWTVLSTNTFSPTGGFSVTNTIGSGSRYFILSIPQ